jgi:hypothetical protein
VLSLARRIKPGAITRGLPAPDNPSHAGGGEMSNPPEIRIKNREMTCSRVDGAPDAGITAVATWFWRVKNKYLPLDDQSATPAEIKITGFLQSAH